MSSNPFGVSISTKTPYISLPVSPQGYSALENVSDDFMARLRANERTAIEQLGINYYRATKALIPVWQEAYAKLQWAKQQGFSDEYLSGFIWSEQRMARIVAGLFERFTELGRKNGLVMELELERAAQLAGGSVSEYITQQIAEAGGFAKRGGVSIHLGGVPHVELEMLTSRLGDGSPLVDSLADRFGADGVDMAKRQLVAGLANGENPAQLARRMAAAMGAHAGKTAVLLRTEMMRVYRDSQLLNMKANPKYVEGWYWLSALQETTCPMCWAMHGTRHTLDERMETHPACRCSMRPILRKWGEIDPSLSGLPEPKPEPSGVTLFGKLPDASQRRIMGPKMHQAFKDGRFTLSNVVKRTYSPKWGAGRTQRSTAELIGGPKTTGGGRVAKPAPKRASAPVAQVAEPPKALKPNGPPVSGKLVGVDKLPTKGESGRIGNEIRETVKLIDSVHGDGTMANVSVVLNQRTSAFGHFASRYGPYVPGTYDRTYIPKEIAVSKAISTGHHVRMTFAHETGHYIDQQHFGALGKGVSTGYGTKQRLPQLDAWKDAVINSRAYTQLNNLLQPGAMVNFPAISGGFRQVPADKAYVRYALDPLEAWARSYAQWVATKTQDPGMLAELNELRDPLKAYHQTQWADDDFAPIAKAFDDIFEAEGWLK